MEAEHLQSVIESLLFAHGEPLKISQIAKIAGISKPEAENILMLLKGKYASEKRGVALVQKNQEVQMVANPDNASYVQQLLHSELQGSLSSAALEVLSIIAYRGPITRADIEVIRGVNCSYTLRNILMRGLVERVDNPRDARGYVYSISFDFLRKLGVKDIKDLPEYDVLSHSEKINSILTEK